MTRSVLAFPRPSRKEDSDYLRYVRRQGCLLPKEESDGEERRNRMAKKVPAKKPSPKKK